MHPVIDSSLRGRVFVFAGRLADLSRQEAATLVRTRGGATRHHVTRRTSFLVLGDAAPGRARRRSRKLMAAERLASTGAGIRIITETEFLKLVGFESAIRLRDRYYTTRDVRRLFGLEPRALRSLEKLGLTRPIMQTGAERYYTFSDLLLFRQVHAAAERGVPLERAARRLLQTRGGQTQMQFDAGPLVLPFERSDHSTWTADDWYSVGCEHDEEPVEIERAIEAYQRSLALDPYHIGALINLGNLRYDRGEVDEARGLYERALASDPDNAVARFNLGNVHDDLGDYERAIRYFQSAIDLRPDKGDAYFNLGLVYDRLGQVREVRENMRQYLRLSPEGDMAEIASEYLRLTEETGTGDRD